MEWNWSQLDPCATARILASLTRSLCASVMNAAANRLLSDASLGNDVIDVNPSIIYCRLLQTQISKTNKWRTGDSNLSFWYSCCTSLGFSIWCISIVFRATFSFDLYCRSIVSIELIIAPPMFKPAILLLLFMSVWMVTLCDVVWSDIRTYNGVRSHHDLVTRLATDACNLNSTICYWYDTMIVLIIQSQCEMVIIRQRVSRHK